MEEEQLPTPEQTIKELQEKTLQLEKEKEEYLSGWKRAKSDLLTFQKEIDEKMKNFAQMAHAGLIYDLLTILDSFDLAIGSLTSENKETSLGKGYYLIQTQLSDALKKYGLNLIGTEKKKFDPNVHEAIDTKKCERPDCDGQDDGFIVEVLSKGYLLHNQLIRAAKVKVITH